MMQTLQQKAEKIRCLVCDVDGVLTDGLLYYDNTGNEAKTFHVHDGIGLKLLMAVDIQVAIITGAIATNVDHRMKSLGIAHYFKNKIDKREAFLTLQQELQLDAEAFAYIGDDFPDIPLIQQSGLGIAVANALPSVKAAADWQTTKSGGQGAVREVCDLILQAQNKTELAITRYLTPAS